MAPKAAPVSPPAIEPLCDEGPDPYMSEVHEVLINAMAADPMINKEDFRVFMKRWTCHLEKYSN
jgi:hypothetical protein